MVKKDIDKWSFGYEFFRPYQVLMFKIFYRKFEVHYSKNVQKGESTIIAVNHQNALMDALAVINATPCQPVFLARADIFKKPGQAKFLQSIKILPVYRMRDGVETLKKNEEIFETTLSILRNKLNPLALMPEGRHGDRQRLRPLVKGVFRIAFMAQQDYKENNGINIVPVGINIGHYTNVKTDILVVFGRSIEVSDYWKAYEENPVQTTNELRNKLSEEMKKVMINIESEEYYQLYQRLRKIYGKKIREKLEIKGKKQIHKFRGDKHLISALDICLEEDERQIKTLNDLTEEYWEKLYGMNLRDWVLEKKKISLISLVLESLLQLFYYPLQLIGFILNYIPYYIVSRLTKGVKDPQFLSSFKFVLGLILFPIWYILLLIPAIIFSPIKWIPLILVVTLPLIGNLTLYNFIRLKKLKAKWKYKLLLLFKNKAILELISLRNGVVACTDETIDKYLPKVKFDWLP